MDKEHRCADAPDGKYIKKAAIVFAAAVLLLQVACMLAGIRYAAVGTDVLRAGEARFLYVALSVLSPLTSYLRLAVLLWFCFYAGAQSARPFLAVTLASLLLSAVFEVISAAAGDYYFADNALYHVGAAGLGLLIGVCATVFLWAYTASRSKKLAAGKETRFKRAPHLPCYIAAALTMAAIDLLYRTYLVVSMALSEGGVSFATAEDVRALVWDYSYPLVKSAAGFVFMCLAGVLLAKRIKKTGD